MSPLPAIDMHAHVHAEISESALAALDAVIFAVSRSLEEATICVRRSDPTTVWGVGCHPGLAKAHATFEKERFAELLQMSAFAGELGLDGKVRVPLEAQRATLRTALSVLAEIPRIVSLHSYAATEELVSELEEVTPAGCVLHWWLGDIGLTRRAVELGCFFSIPPAVARRRDLLESIPLDRCLTETDHPFGDRRSTEPKPGNVGAVEEALASHHHLSSNEVRSAIWANLGRLVKTAGCGRLLPPRVRTLLATLPPA